MRPTGHLPHKDGGDDGPCCVCVGAGGGEKNTRGRRHAGGAMAGGEREKECVCKGLFSSYSPGLA